MPQTILYINSSDHKRQDDSWKNDPYGIYMVSLDTETGQLEIIDRDDTVDATQFFHVDAVNNRMYVAYRGDSPIGDLLAFDIDPATGKLSYLNRQPTGNSSVTYVGMSKDKRFAIAVNYSSPDCVGQVNVFPIAENGEVLPILQSIQHEGKGANEDRQECSHPHMIDIDPTGKLVLVPDLGIDKLMLYDLDTETGKLSPHDPAYMPAVAGSGPRHFTFSPDGQYLYVINELSATIQPYRYDATAGSLTALALVPTLPEELMEGNTGADIHITPDGKYLYSTNRGHNSIAMFKIDEGGGLSLIGRESTRGDHPRHFNIDPSGQFLIVGNQFTSDVYCFHIDGDTGKLEYTGYELTIPKPSCIYPYVLED